jgi:phage baseplate assembly protein V
MLATSPSKSNKRCYYGVVQAIVADIADPEKEGRVKVTFPWFDESTVSEWCRVSQMYAGSGYGTFWTPELKDEVLVAFIHGDMRHPIIVGGLYNGVDKPPTYRAEDKDEKVLRTKAGHEIRFVDTNGEERITIVDKSEKHRIEINTKDNSITIQSEGGKITLAADEIIIKADSSLKIDASTIEGTASGEMTLKGSTINLN